MRKGAVQEDVVKLIKGCFTLIEQQKCTKSRYSTRRGCIVIDDSGAKDIINSVKKSGAFDLTLGLSDKEKKIHAARYGLGKVGDFIKYGEAVKGSVEAHNFSSELTCNTTSGHKKRGQRSDASGKTLSGPDVCSVGATTFGTATVAAEERSEADETFG